MPPSRVDTGGGFFLFTGWSRVRRDGYWLVFDSAVRVMMGARTRTVRVDELVGAVEIARRLGVARPQVVYSWRSRHEDFPRPVTRLSIGLVWVWGDVERWARRTGRV